MDIIMYINSINIVGRNDNKCQNENKAFSVIPFSFRRINCGRFVRTAFEYYLNINIEAKQITHM